VSPADFVRFGRSEPSLRHANVSTTATCCIKTAAEDVRGAMTKLENHIAEAGQTQQDTNGTLHRVLESGSPTIQ